MNRLHLPLLLTCLALAVLVSLASAQPEGDDAFWGVFDRVHPELAGRGPDLWDEAGKAAADALQSADHADYPGLQRLLFQAKVQSALDHLTIADAAGDPGKAAQAQARADALQNFEQAMKTIGELRAKPDDQLTTSDMRQLIRAVAVATGYVNTSRFESLELELAELRRENEELRAQLDAQPTDPSASVGVSADATTTSPAAGRAAPRGSFQAYADVRRIRIGGDDVGHSHDQSQVRVVGAWRNRPDVPTSFSFQVVVQRSGGQPVGLRTVQTPVLQPGAVHEINEVVPVTHSAYARRVDIRNVRVSP